MIIRIEGFKIHIIKQEKVGPSDTISTPTVSSVYYAQLERKWADDKIDRIYVMGERDGTSCAINCRSIAEVLFCIKEIRIWARENNIDEFKIISNGRVRLC